MADEQTTPEHRGDVESEEVSSVGSAGGASVGRRKPPSGRSAGRWAIRFVLVILAVIIGGFIYLIDITVHPASGPDGFQVRRVASTASKHLSSSPDVISAETTEASADLGATTSTGRAPQGQHQCGGGRQPAGLYSPEDTPAGTPLQRRIRHLRVLERQGQHHRHRRLFSTRSRGHPDRRETSTHPRRRSEVLHRQHRRVSGTDNRLRRRHHNSHHPDPTRRQEILQDLHHERMEGHLHCQNRRPVQQPTLDQLITATKQASPTGTIDLAGTTLSVTGLATDENKGLTPDAAAPSSTPSTTAKPQD